MMFGLYMIWFRLFIIGTALYFISLIFDVLLDDHPMWNSFGSFSLYSNPLKAGIFASLIGLIIISSIGFTTVATNVIQFGIDQLQDFPSRDSFLSNYFGVQE